MPIVINNKKFSLSLNIKTIIDELKKLPEPDIIPLHQHSINPEETVLCLQREMGYIDEFNLTNIKYLGSKNVVSCILLYLSSETDHLVVHVDDTKHIDLVSVLSAFNNKNGIKAMLVGGIPGQVSENNLRNIIEALLQVSKKLEIDITIEKQKIIECNKFTTDDRYSFIYDKILEKANRLSYQYFNKQLDLNYLSARTIVDLQERSVGLSTELQMIAAALSQAVELYKDSNMNNIKQLQSIFNHIVKTEDDFKKYIDKMFSKEGFKLLNIGYEQSKLYRDSKLSHFVFDIFSKKVYTISERMTTPNESYRSVVCLDTFKQSQYFLSYDGKKGTYIMPELTQEFVDHCQSLKPIVMKDYLSDKDIAEITMTIKINNHIPTLNELANFIKRSLQIKFSDNFSLLQTVFFDTGKKSSNMYTNFEISTQNLIKINRITGYEFTAKIRRYPEYTVDAILACDSENQAKKIIEKIQKTDITAKLMRFSDGNFCVCIPAINVESYANQISRTFRLT